MDCIHAIILGIVEGLTEFLPVSSTGHLIIAEDLLHVDPQAPQWRVFLFVSQLGAIGAVVLFFWRDLWQRTFHPTTRVWQQHILTKLVLAMIPTVIGGLLLNKYMEKLEDSPRAVAAALIVGALVMELIDRRYRRTRPMELEDVTAAQAVLIGAIQCLSMWPGTSRAAASILGGMALGLTPRVAVEFSFYLAIPTMLAAGIKRLWDYGRLLQPEHAAVVMVGTAVAFVVALVVVAAFMEYVRRYRFTPFAIYRVVLGAAVLLYFWR